jgi:hypothetical protein
VPERYRSGIRERLIANCARQGDFWCLAVQFGAEELLYNSHRGDYELLNLAYYLAVRMVLTSLYRVRMICMAETDRLILERSDHASDQAPSLPV